MKAGVPVYGVPCRPISFRPDMVEAIGAGRKTQTRRVMSPQPPGGGARRLREVVWGGAAEKLSGRDRAARAWAGLDDARAPGTVAYYGCPYGRPGHLLWVREPHWRFTGLPEHGRPWEGFVESPSGDPYAARCYDDFPNLDGLMYACAAVRMPSIHMPRWATRLVLRITDVRLERLLGISDSDAQAEGAAPVLVPPDGGSCPHVEGFAQIWESIHGPGSWKINPWVWALTFEVLWARPGAGVVAAKGNC